MTGRLTGKRAIVTGAGSGIGRASARLFAAEGANVMAVDVNEGGLAETVAGRFVDESRVRDGCGRRTDRTSSERPTEKCASTTPGRAASADWSFSSSTLSRVRRSFRVAWFRAAATRIFAARSPAPPAGAKLPAARAAQRQAWRKRPPRFLGPPAALPVRGDDGCTRRSSEDI